MINSTLCYIEKDGKYLMLHRVKKENDANKDKWIGIGGKFEDKESPEDCILREAKEETGLTLTDYRYRGIVTFVSDKWETEYMHLFTATGFSGELIDCDEGELEWISREKLDSIPKWEGDRIFLELLQKGEPFFSLKLRYKGEKLMEAVRSVFPIVVIVLLLSGTRLRGAVTGMTLLSFLLGAVMLMAAIAVMNTAILLHGDTAAALAVPSLYLARRISPVLGAVFSVFLVMGIFSCCSAMLWTVCSKFSVGDTRKDRLIAVGVVIGVFLLGLLPFGELIGAFYPIIGYMGWIFIGCVLVKGLRRSSPL